MKYLLKSESVLAVLLLAASSTGAIAGDWAIAGDGCKIWNPHPTLGETIRWTGACRDGFVPLMAREVRGPVHPGVRGAKDAAIADKRRTAHKPITCSAGHSRRQISPKEA